jgi:hypothetical protein
VLLKIIEFVLVVLLDRQQQQRLVAFSYVHVVLLSGHQFFFCLILSRPNDVRSHTGSIHRSRLYIDITFIQPTKAIIIIIIGGGVVKK